MVNTRSIEISLSFKQRIYRSNGVAQENYIFLLLQKDSTLGSDNKRESNISVILTVDLYGKSTGERCLCLPQTEVKEHFFPA